MTTENPTTPDTDFSPKSSRRWPIRSMRDLLQALPETRRSGAYLDVDHLSEDDRQQLCDRADEVVGDAVSSIHSIGVMLFWVSQLEEFPEPDN